MLMTILLMLTIILSATQGPGASDNMLNCGIMMEVKILNRTYIDLLAGRPYHDLEKSRIGLRLDLPLQRGRGVWPVSCSWVYNQA